MKVIARILLLTSLIFTLDWSLDLGTSPLLLTLFAALAVLASKKLLQIKLNSLAIILVVATTYLITEFVLSQLSVLSLPAFKGSLTPTNLSEHLRLCTYVFLFSL